MRTEYSLYCGLQAESKKLYQSVWFWSLTFDRVPLFSAALYLRYQ